MINAAVVDASIAIKWVIEEVGSSHARRIWRARLSAPDLLLIECANVLWRKVRLNELEEDAARARLDLLSAAPVSLFRSDQLVTPALQLALDLGRPVYDCIYLALAARQKLMLVTADERFVRAVRQVPEFADRVRTLDSLTN